MESKEFVTIRHHLGKSQRELARLLCLSPRTVQSIEQGLRRVPSYIERQMMLLFSLSRSSAEEDTGPCWSIIDCPDDWKENCFVWEQKSGYYCWLINGTFCHGKYQENWERKLDTCRECKVFQLRLQ